MKKKIIVLFLICVIVGGGATILHQNSNEMDLLSSIDINDIEGVHHSSWTGGEDGYFEKELSDNEMEQFINLLKNVQIGKKVSNQEAESTGAVTYYLIKRKDGSEINISPGRYFFIDNSYYDFVNYNELWDEFIDINSR